MAEAVRLLKHLTLLTDVTLGFSACEYGEEDLNGPFDPWHYGPYPPSQPLAELDRLTQLRLHLVALPPDWRQLSGLQRLRLNKIELDSDFQPEWLPEPLTGLSSLTRLELAAMMRMPGECAGSQHINKLGVQVPCLS